MTARELVSVESPPIQHSKYKTTLRRFFFLGLQHNEKHSFKFNLLDDSFFVCARCTGISLGVLFGLLIMTIDLSNLFTKPCLFLFSLALALPAIIDWTSVANGIWQGNNNLRFITGIFLGLGGAFYRSIGTDLFIWVIIPVASILTLILTQQFFSSVDFKSLLNRQERLCHNCEGDHDWWGCLIILIIGGIVYAYYTDSCWVVYLIGGIIVIAVVVIIILSISSDSKIKKSHTYYTPPPPIQHSQWRPEPKTETSIKNITDEFTSCPICGVSVKITNLDRHLHRVHGQQEEVKQDYNYERTPEGYAPPQEFHEPLLEEEKFEYDAEHDDVTPAQDLQEPESIKPTPEVPEGTFDASKVPEVIIPHELKEYFDKIHEWEEMGFDVAFLYDIKDDKTEFITQFQRFKKQIEG